MDTFEAELHAIALRCSREFRVLRKLERRRYYERPLEPPMKIGLIVDVETTGLDPRTDDIIEVGLLKFAYTPAGVVLGPIGEYMQFNEPSKPIPRLVNQLTGITDDMVRGHKLNTARLQEFAADADIVIAHNAAFDRKFMEKVSPIFCEKPWACSQTQVPWSDEGFEGTKLFYIAYQYHFYFEGHRSIDDALALLEILEQPLPRSGQTVMAQVLRAAGQPASRVYALGAPYEVKDRLKTRGYRWSTGDDGCPRAWHRDVEPHDVPAELEFLDSLGRPDLIEPLVMELDAYLRFSDRQA